MATQPTLKDVSTRAGVSVYTASRALAGKDGVSEETRERVRAIAKELGYVRNGVAASLRTESSRAVGVLTASGRNQYYSELVASIDVQLQGHGYFTVTVDTIKDGEVTEEREREALRRLLIQRPAAIVTTYALSPSSLAAIDSFGLPLLYIDAIPCDERGKRPFVGSDNAMIGRMAAEFLADAGHKHVGIVAYPAQWATRAPRIEAFAAIAAEQGMSVTVIEAGATPEEARRAVGDLLEVEVQTVDALFCLNTLLAQGAIAAVGDAGLRIPGDVSVVAVDDFDWAPLLTPPLTVVAQDLRRIGEAAADRILECVEGPDRPRTHEEFPCRLVERGSCAHRGS